MPKVPRVTGLTEELGAEPDTRGRVPVDAAAFGGQVGEALGDVSSTLSEIASREKKFSDERDANRALEVYGDFNSSLRAHLFDDEEGMYSKKGGAAKDVVKDTSEFLDNQGQLFAGETDNENQRVLLKKLMDNRRDSTLNGLATYSLKQNEIYKKEVLGTTVKNAIEDVVSDFDNEETFSNSRGIVAAAILSQSEGTPDATTIDEIEDTISSLHEARIIAMAESNPANASLYYKGIKGEVNPTKRKEVEKVLKDESFRAEVQEETDNIMSEGGTLGEIKDKARAITKSDVRDEVSSRVGVRYKEIEFNKSEVRRKNTEGRWNDIDGGLKEGKSHNELMALANNQPDLATRSNMRDYIGKTLGEGKVDTDWKIYAKLKNVAVEDPEAFKEMDIYSWKPHLNETEFKEILSAQSKLKEGKSYTPFVTRQRAMNGVLNSLGINHTARKGSDAEDTSVFYRLMGEKVEEKETALGRQLTTKEFNETMGEFTREVTTDGFFGNTVKPFFQVDEADRVILEEDEDFHVPGQLLSRGVFITRFADIPPKEKEKIVDYFQRSRNRVPSNKEVVDTYNIKLGRNK